MKFTRRNFIQSSAVAALAAAVGNAAGGHGFSRRGLDPVSYLLREHFEPFLNTAIRITNDEGAASVIWLRQAVDLKIQVNVDRGLTGDSFKLGFESSRKTRLGQGIYHFDHENLGRFSLFLTPVGGTGIHSEAIINRVC